MYLLYDGEKLVYVGQSSDMRRRWYDHRRELKAWQAVVADKKVRAADDPLPKTKKKFSFTTARWWQVEDHQERLRVEAILVLLHLPPENGMIALGVRGGTVWEVGHKSLFHTRGRRKKTA